MLTLPQLKARQTEILAEIRRLLDHADSEHRNLNKDESEKATALESEFDATAQRIVREERLSSHQSAITKAYNAAAEPRGVNLADNDGGTDTNGEGGQPEPVVDPATGVEQRKKSGPFASLGQQIQAVIRSHRSGEVDRRLLEVRAPSGMSTLIGADGGYAVQQDFALDLSSSAHKTGLLPSMCKQLPISNNSNGIKIPLIDETSRATGSRGGGVTAYWEGEGETKTGSKPKLRILELKLKKLIGLTYLTDELLEDAAALEAWVSELFRAEFGFQLDEGIVNGTGVGQPLGFMNSPALVTQAKVSMQTADTINWMNVSSMYSRMPAYSLSSAVWLHNQDAFPALANMAFDSGATNPTVPIFIPANNAAGAPNNSILGKPLIAIEQAATVGDLGDIAFVDLSKYLLATKGGIRQASSIHVKFVEDQTALRWVMRVDGQPMPRSPITPYKGTVTVSPFVVLEAR